MNIKPPCKGGSLRHRRVPRRSSSVFCLFALNCQKKHCQRRAAICCAFGQSSWGGGAGCRQAQGVCMGSQTGQIAQQATSDPSWQARQQRCAPGLHLFRRSCRAWRTLRRMPSKTCCERWAAACVGLLLGVLGGQLGPFPAALEEAAASNGRDCAFSRVRHIM